MTAQRIAIVIPVFDEAENLELLLPELREVLSSRSVAADVFVVDDGSRDGSSDVALRHGATVLRTGRNRGKSAALQAGFDATTDYDLVITMDGDGQDDPTEIDRLLGALGEHDVVSGWKRERSDSVGKRLQSRLFTGLVRLVSRVRLHDFNCGLKVYRREVLDTISVYGELHRLIPVLAVAEGFSVGEVPVNHRPRAHGRSKFGWSRAFRGPLDLITVMFLTRFGQRPLHVFGLWGLALAFAGFVIGVYLSWLRLVGGEGIGDRPLLLLAVLLMIAGLQLFAVGLLGEMLLALRGETGPRPFRLVLPAEEAPDPPPRTEESEEGEAELP